MTLYELLEEIHAIDAELQKLERKYGIRSETFYQWYISGREPENLDSLADFSLWAGLYKIKLAREGEYDRVLHKAMHDLSDVPRIMEEARVLAGVH